ncbi:MAG: radical SAM protein, partial [Desulfobacterales bacterium]|nr:radical SAM protein [Desulfobacterales bacterium]
DISLRGSGETASPEQIAEVMILLQNQGCHNINFVTPTHVVPFILQAVDLALNMGLNLPLVYNCSGYETPDTLSLLDGIIDIYMPDFKFWDKKIARMACNAPDYPEVAKEAVKIMHKQVGDLCLDSDEIAQSGLLVRHLVLPHDFAGTESVMAFLAERVSKNTRVNIMSQYRPCGTADSIPELSRTITVDEYHRARQTAQSFGLHLLR